VFVFRHLEAAGTVPLVVRRIAVTHAIAFLPRS
jgi:hypothetical protein